MKKIVSGILIVVMLLSLTGCSSKSDDVKRVERLIKGIGTVTLEREQYIIEAEQAYDALPMAEKDTVGNYKKLIGARNEFENLKLDSIASRYSSSLNGSEFRYVVERDSKYIWSLYSLVFNGEEAEFHFIDYGKLDNYDQKLASGKYTLQRETYTNSQGKEVSAIILRIGNSEFVADVEDYHLCGFYSRDIGKTLTSK